MARISCALCLVLSAVAHLASATPEPGLTWGSERVNAPLDKGLDFAGLLERLWTYQPELPKHLLDASKGFTGDTSNLGRVLGKMIKGEPVKIVLIGGSLSLRGWNSSDQSYIKQLHKWLELVFVPGCSQQLSARLSLVAQSGQGSEQHSATAGVAEDAYAHTSQTGTHPGDHLTQADEAGSDDDEMQDASRRRLRDAATLAATQGAVTDTSPLSTEPHHQPDTYYQQFNHVCSTSRITLLNLAVAAAGPAFAERCVLTKVPEDTDLLIMDWGVSDFVRGDHLSHPERHALERIIRSVAVLPNQPAIVMFAAYSWMQAAGTFVGQTKYVSSLTQDKHALLAEWYGSIQVVSSRATLYQLLSGSDDPERRLMYLGVKGDMLHVSSLGHRWYADILINFFRDHINTLLLRAITHKALSSHRHPITGGTNQLPEFLSQQLMAHSGLAPGVDAEQGGKACWTGVAAQDGTGCEVQGNLGASYLVPSSANGLKPPFFKYNEVDALGVCALGTDFQPLAIMSDGWEWEDHGRPGQPKLGYTTTKPMRPLVLQFDIEKQLSGPRSSRGEVGGGGSGHTRDRSQNVRAWLIYLQSWQGMGRASVSCSFGCSCQNSTVDGMAKDLTIKATVPVLHGFILQPEMPGELCTIEVMMLPTDEAVRFKVMGITSSTNSVFHLSEVIGKGYASTVDQQATV